MSERRTYEFRNRLEEISARFKRTSERIEQIPRERETTIIVVEEQMRDSVAIAARSRVGQALKQLRLAHGFSYADLQQRTNLSQQLLWDVEYNERRLNLEELRRLAECYQIKPGDILGIDID